MSEWEGKSDFEINKAVAKLVGIQVCDEQYLGLHDRDENVVLCVDDIGFSDGVDYCNEPQDAWSIILGNKISLQWSYGYWCASSPFPGTHFSIKVDSDGDLLRAAMIVYLEMNGVKPNE